MVLGFIVLLVLLALAVAALVWLVRQLRAPTDTRAVLDRRYAAGESTREEYLQARADLEQ